MKKVYGNSNELLQEMLKSKEKYEKDKENYTFEEKLKYMVRLQKKSYAMGQTKIKPWPIDTE